MKALLLTSLLLSLMSWAHADNISNDLKLLQRRAAESGGAGNGGGKLALRISQQLNEAALAAGVKNIRGFASAFTLLVGDYAFCGEVVPACERALAYYPKQHALLVDKTNWQSLGGEGQEKALSAIVAEILDAL